MLTVVYEGSTNVDVREGAAVLGTVSVVPGTVSVDPGTVSVDPGTVRVVPGTVRLSAGDDCEEDCVFSDDVDSGSEVTAVIDAAGDVTFDTVDDAVLSCGMPELIKLDVMLLAEFVSVSFTPSFTGTLVPLVSSANIVLVDSLLSTETLTSVDELDPDTVEDGLTEASLVVVSPCL